MNNTLFGILLIFSYSSTSILAFRPRSGCRYFVNAWVLDCSDTGSFCSSVHVEAHREGSSSSQFDASIPTETSSEILSAEVTRSFRISICFTMYS